MLSALIDRGTGRSGRRWPSCSRTRPARALLVDFVRLRRSLPPTTEDLRPGDRPRATGSPPGHASGAVLRPLAAALLLTAAGAGGLWLGERRGARPSARTVAQCLLHPRCRLGSEEQPTPHSTRVHSRSPRTLLSFALWKHGASRGSARTQTARTLARRHRLVFVQGRGERADGSSGPDHRPSTERSQPNTPVSLQPARPDPGTCLPWSPDGPGWPPRRRGRMGRRGTSSSEPSSRSAETAPPSTYARSTRALVVPNGWRNRPDRWRGSGPEVTARPPHRARHPPDAPMTGRSPCRRVVIQLGSQTCPRGGEPRRCCAYDLWLVQREAGRTRGSCSDSRPTAARATQGRLSCSRPRGYRRARRASLTAPATDSLETSISGNGDKVARNGMGQRPDLQIETERALVSGGKGGPLSLSGGFKQLTCTTRRDDRSHPAAAVGSPDRTGRPRRARSRRSPAPSRVTARRFG